MGIAERDFARVAEMRRGDGSAGGYGEFVSAADGAPMMSDGKRLLRARDLCALIAAGDGRGRVTDIRQFCKDWAASDDSRRLKMIADVPRRLRWWHRLGARRFDLVRIAAVVDALCDRDDVPVPPWVSSFRARRAVTLSQPRFATGPWNDYIRSEAPAACARRNVWFRPIDLEDYRVHGFG